MGLSSAVELGQIPGSVRAISSLPEIDYADRYTLPTDAEATPEQWARAVFGDVPDVAERFIWRGLLGLRLTRGPSPATVAGWRIGGRGEDWIRLETASRSLGANLIVQTVEGRVSLTTCLDQGRRRDELVWRRLSAVHRRLVPRVLRDAERRIREGR
ncbi:hypothetical protein [Geodermatophilus obscurus]|uniref:DUF2867 domain-containing protein n=1 Tax=Geodermatophilus obscurus (strain ATCC 25078 / DSM 43160 / JCM 3152 / CCUG 61914 / KCC A-0152 / KCTC 9177 / NBRC 13315 / NRRL B-3577 / G-20) TaxID=526225 RepID=D2SBY6_GEOOG|nr:hypothetical protein [Geodermatophilus obscurus]ADB74154.1 conserved hypothetical protein [Geodermatophilus obscurus DSM 43160]